MPLQPTAEQLAELASGPEGPVVMVNLLKFAPQAKGRSELTGEAMYARYGVRVQPILRKVGARVMWHGRGDQVLIGDTGDRWDAVILISYPSRKAFLELIRDPAYAEVSRDREAALVDARLIVTTQLAPAV